jgi:DNA polymerase-3 subunit beta
MAIAPAVQRSTGLQLDRKALLAALTRMQAVAANRSCKPILNGVRMHARDGVLTLAATDGELSVSSWLPVEGDLPTTVVNCSELVRRLKASREPIAVLAVRHRAQQLIVNGGRVEHALPTLPAEDFPVVPSEVRGTELRIDAPELRFALGVAVTAVARETSRYAINGVLLESDGNGVRLVATDGRRLVTTGLASAKTDWQASCVLPQKFVQLATKFLGDLPDPIKLHVHRPDAKAQAELFVQGADWLLSSRELDGTFPQYRDVIPMSHSRFSLERKLLAGTLREVLLATDEMARSVSLTLRSRSAELAARSPDLGTASAKLPARYLGGGDPLIYTGFNPRFLLDAIESVPDTRVVIDVQQNGAHTDGTVFHRPARISGERDSRVQWVLMPVSLNLPATREHLGSNYREEAAPVAPPA